MVYLVFTMGIFSFLAGLAGYIFAKSKVFILVERLANQIDSSRHHLFLTAGWAHGASYIVGIIGGIWLSIKIWRKRE